MDRPEQQSLFGTYIENHSGGKINIINRPPTTPQESLGPNKSLRWTPTELDDLKQAMKRDSAQEFNPYVRSITKIASHYTASEIDNLINDRALHRFVMDNKPVLLKFFETIRKS